MGGNGCCEKNKTTSGVASAVAGAARNLRMYIRFCGQNMRGLLEYKNDFAVSTIAGIVWQSFGLIFIFALFANIPSVRGWTLYEVAMLYSCVMLGEGALTLLFQGTTSLAYRVRVGEFDRYMLRPLPLTTQLLGLQLNFAGLGTMLIGAVVFTISASLVGAAVSLPGVCLFIINVCIGIGIRVNINLATTSLAFRFIEISGFTSMIYNTQEFAKYPLDIFPSAIRIILLTILPHAIISYVPVCIFLGELAVWPFILVPPASLALMSFIRRAIFSAALRRYESSGN